MLVGVMVVSVEVERRDKNVSGCYKEGGGIC